VNSSVASAISRASDLDCLSKFLMEVLMRGVVADVPALDVALVYRGSVRAGKPLIFALPNCGIP